jgi:hypothetical protein
VHHFRQSLSFLAAAQPRLETDGNKRHFLAEVGNLNREEPVT